MQPGKPLPGIRSLMAVINSVGVGRGSKSVGEFTYRYTRGRTIASRRITRNISNTPAQVGQRGAFGSFMWTFSPYKWFFSDAYEKTKHGSSFNQFVHVNRELLGKSPYNSEVNKKLIPNGARLFSLLSAIVPNGVPHLKYAAFGSLPFVNKSTYTDSDSCIITFAGDLFVEDFKGISVEVLGVSSLGNVYSKEIPLYGDSDVPSFSFSSQYPGATGNISITSEQSTGTVTFSMRNTALAVFLLEFNAETTSTGITVYMNIVIKQYGKIASVNSFVRAPLPANSSSSNVISDTNQAENTEVE